jgi:hypothetical protein
MTVQAPRSTLGRKRNLSGNQSSQRDRGGFPRFYGSKRSSEKNSLRRRIIGRAAMVNLAASLGLIGRIRPQS